MRGDASVTTLLRPRSPAEALRLFDLHPEALPIAGGTDLMVAWNAGGLAGRTFLDLSPLAAWRRIRSTKDALVAGALATHTELMRHPVVRRRLPLLAEACATVGGVQIQNRGTLGGNVANASPAGDTLPVLAALDAAVVLRSAAEERRVLFSAFYTGYRQTVRRPDELITAIEIPAVAGAQWFRKVGTRAAQAISKVVMAAVRADAPRIALGSVAPTVVRLPRTEAILAAGGSIADAQGALADEIQPIDDIRSTEAYRRRVAGNLLGQFWKETG
jgi:CO/xanthine dehydrogenase FAD-binding subunit